MNARRRDSKRKNWPANLYQKADGYFWYRDPNTKKTKGLGHDRVDAFDAAITANLALASKKSTSLADWVRGVGIKSLDEWAAEYEATYIAERGAKKNTVTQMKSNVKAIRAAEFAKKQINTVTTLDISTFLKSTVTERGPRAAQQIRRTAFDMFFEAEAAGLIERGTNPVEVTKQNKAPVVRDRLSLEQFLKIRAEATGWLVNAMNLAIVSGQSRENIADAEFEDFKEEGVWKCIRGKTDVKIRIPLSLRLDDVNLSLEDVVKQCRDRFLSKALIHYTRSYQGVKAGEKVGLQRISKAFAAARDKAGVEPREGRKPPSFHEIRSLAERLYEKKYGPEFTQKLLGHKSAKMTALYHDSRGSEWINVVVG